MSQFLKEFKKVTPVFDDSKRKYKYYCPVCDRGLHIGVPRHPFCEVEFVWDEKAFARQKNYDIRRVLYPSAFSNISIAEHTHYSDNYISSMLSGKSPLAVGVRTYLIKELKNHIKTLTALYEELEKEF